VFALVFCQSQADDKEKLESCTAWGDPHLTNFPRKENEKVSEVWCQETGWQTLLDNEYLNGYILISPKPYVITSFNFGFFDDDHKRFCVFSENEFSLAPRKCGEDITITKDGNFLTILYKSRDITVTIQKYDWNQPGSPYAYSITVLQPAYLISTSKGLCKTSCDPNSGKALERQQRANYDQNLIQKSAENICQIAIATLVPEFKITSLNQMNLDTRNAYSACVTDIRVSGNLMFAKNAVTTLAIKLATKDLPPRSDLQKILDKVYAHIKEINPRIDSAVSQFMDNPTPTPSKDDNIVVFKENEAGSISCLRTYSGVIKIVSASYGSRSTSCSMDATTRVKEICIKSPRSCQFTVSNTLLQKNPCGNEEKQLKIIYKCVERN